jgi:hypothetical protein
MAINYKIRFACVLIIGMIVWPNVVTAGKNKKVSSINQELPLRLAWGDSRETIEKKGITLNEREYRTRGVNKDGEWEDKKVQNSIKTFLIRRKSGKLPINSAMILIDDTHGLIQILWQEENIENDVFGEIGLAKYATFHDKFTKKYGAPVQDIDWMESRYVGTAAFYNCLKPDSRRCGEILSAWISRDMSIKVTLLGVGTTGNISITYRHKSIFDAVEELYYNNIFGTADASIKD